MPRRPFKTLPREEQKAAFAHMDAKNKAADAAKKVAGGKNLGSGERHKAATAKKAATAQDSAPARVRDAIDKRRADERSAKVERQRAEARERALGGGSRYKKLTGEHALNARIAQLDDADKKLAAIQRDMKDRKITPAQARERMRAVQANLEPPPRGLGTGQRAKKLAAMRTPKTRDPVGDAHTLAQDFAEGHTVTGELHGGANSGKVEKVRLANGRQAVLKQVNLRNSENPDEIKDAHFAGLVAGAIGIDHSATAIVGRNKTLAELVPGITAEQHRINIGELNDDGSFTGRHDELNRMMDLKGAREIALLDFLSGNIDRNSGNYMIDGDTVRPIDHGFAIFSAKSKHDQDPNLVRLNGPFAQRHLHPDHKEQKDSAFDTGQRVPVSELTSPFSAKELADIKSRLEALRPAFAAKKSNDKYAFMMKRFAMLEQAAKRK